MTQESGAPDVEYGTIVLADDLRDDLDRLAENVAHAAEPNVQHVAIELQRIARETERRASRVGNADAASRTPVVAIDLARHVMRTSTTPEQSAWWRREVMFLERVTAVTVPQRRWSPASG